MQDDDIFFSLKPLTKFYLSVCVVIFMCRWTRPLSKSLLLGKKKWFLTINKVRFQTESIAVLSQRPSFRLRSFSENYQCITFTLTFTFRAFSRRFGPKRLTISTFVTRKKPQHIILQFNKKLSFSFFFTAL